MAAIGALNLQPALTVMKVMVAQKQPKPQSDAAIFGLSAGASSSASGTEQASDDFYFGTGMTVTKLMFALMGKVVGYLNEKLEAGSDGDAAEVEAAEAWRSEALLDVTPIGSDKDFTIPEPGKDGVAFREAAKVIEDRFDMDFLARDLGLSRMLEKFLGFHLFSADASDIVEAFTDPSGKAAHRLRDALEEGLAGVEGGKVSQRLDRVADGPQSVAEVLADRGSAADTVDEETAQEEKQALEAARMNERLDGVLEMQDRITRKVEDSGDAVAAAFDIISGLVQEEQPATEAPEDTAADPSNEASAEDGEISSEQDAVDAVSDRSIYAALAEAYAEERQDRDEEDRLLFAI